MDPLAVVLAVAGGAWGIVADRIAVRWPEHEEPFVAGRPPGWRTAVCGAVGAVGLGLLPSHFSGPALAVFVAYGAALVLLLATDLDQRLLPDVVTSSAAASSSRSSRPWRSRPRSTCRRSCSGPARSAWAT